MILKKCCAKLPKCCKSTPFLICFGLLIVVGAALKVMLLTELLTGEDDFCR